jgi:hypothetical protein
VVRLAACVPSAHAHAHTPTRSLLGSPCLPLRSSSARARVTVCPRGPFGRPHSSPSSLFSSRPARHHSPRCFARSAPSLARRPPTAAIYKRAHDALALASSSGFSFRSPLASLVS